MKKYLGVILCLLLLLTACGNDKHTSEQNNSLFSTAEIIETPAVTVSESTSSLSELNCSEMLGLKWGDSVDTVKQTMTDYISTYEESHENDTTGELETFLAYIDIEFMGELCDINFQFVDGKLIQISYSYIWNENKTKSDLEWIDTISQKYGESDEENKWYPNENTVVSMLTHKTGVYVDYTPNNESSSLQANQSGEISISMYNGMKFETLNNAYLRNFGTEMAQFDTFENTNQCITLYNETFYYISDNFHLMKFDTNNNTETLLSKVSVESFYRYKDILFFYGEDETGDYDVFMFNLNNETLTQRSDLYYYNDDVFANSAKLICDKIGIDYSYFIEIGEGMYREFFCMMSHEICTVINDKFVIYINANYLESLESSKYESTCDIVLGIDINNGKISYLFDVDNLESDEFRYDEISNHYLMFSNYENGAKSLYRYNFLSDSKEYMADMNDKRMQKYFSIDDKVFGYSNDEFLYRLNENDEIVEVNAPVPDVIYQNGESLYYTDKQSKVYQILKNGEIIVTSIPYNNINEFMSVFTLHNGAIYGTFDNEKIFEYKNGVLTTFSLEGTILGVDENYIYCSGIPYTECTSQESSDFVNKYGESYSEKHGEKTRFYESDDMELNGQIYKIHIN